MKPNVFITINIELGPFLEIVGTANPDLSKR